MKFSIITASYNYEKFIDKAIQSVLNQTYNNWEMIIVDDGSSDNSVNIIKSFCKKDDRIKLFQHENSQNKGLKDTILLALEHAQGEWITFLESDDCFSPDNLSTKANFIAQNPNCNFVFNKVDFVLENPCDEKRKNKFEQSQQKLKKIIFPKNMFYNFFLKNHILTFSCVTVKKEILEKKSFNTPIDKILDWWLWIHLAYKNDFYYINTPLTKWFLHSNSYIFCNQKTLMPIQFRAYFDIFKKHPNFKLFILTIFYFVKLISLKIARFLLKRLKQNY